MEVALERYAHSHGACRVKEEKTSESSHDDEAEGGNPIQQEIVHEEPVTNTMENSLMETGATSSSTQKEEVDELESARVEMGEVREENQRLKKYLDKILKDYRTLQMQFQGLVKQETKGLLGQGSSDNIVSNDDREEESELEQLISLSLGRVLPNSKKGSDAEHSIKSVKRRHAELIEDDEQQTDHNLCLGLDYKYEGSKSTTTEPLPNATSSKEEQEEEKEADDQNGSTWPPRPSKALKTNTSASIGDDHQISQQKKARVCVRARCDTPTMNDGCQWRKYGQKIAKGNPCPRAYYRCTMAPNCSVRKQVQRCAQDMSILITTYEGTHNHPLPMSATAMASTTSAAASMLLSGSTTSQSALPSSAPITSQSHHLLHGFNFNLSDPNTISISNSKPQLYLPNSTSASAPPYPTITLDLTCNPSSSASPFSSILDNPSRCYPNSTSLNFSSSDSNGSSVISWTGGFFNTSTASAPPSYTSRSQLISGRQFPSENIYQYSSNTKIPPPQTPLPDTIAAATKAITADPKFQSALAAALTSIIGTPGGRDHFSQKTKWGDLFPSSSGLSSTASTTANVVGCASSFLNKTTSSNGQQASLIYLPPSLQYSTRDSNTASASASPVGNRDKNTN